MERLRPCGFPLRTPSPGGVLLKSLPLIGVTMGDPAGVGPEIIVMALSDPSLYKICRPVVLGDPGVLAQTISTLSAPAMDLSINTVSTPASAGTTPGVIDLVPLSELKPGSARPGRPDVEGGRAMVKCIVRAVEMALAGEIDAMVTAPISKVLMHQAGYRYEGHTQLISHLTGTRDYVMMLAGERLRVALVTIHCALKQVPKILDTHMVYKTISITAEALRRDFGLIDPRLAVAALNPHAGEDGLFGWEERDIIGPAVQRAALDGLMVEGPFPADTLFYKAASGPYDAVVAMYHDQGLIPLKLLHFSDAVNITLGLPIIRTSVDHGTAYDIAGTGRADPSSLKEAIRMAVLMAENRGRGVSA
ncbi:MAG: 4-hydroxythreonine-4-phosphate dehydrogenase PdxA [Deltaproteobacteria bacterium]|nr:4-hydroxythreonine-4-phosphate dehydrogenase PdxA [Deltaproteobacteria bacterium]